MQQFIKRSTLRHVVRTLLEDKSLGPAMVKVNPVVDPSAAVTDPDNEDFVPQDAVELKVAVSSMVDDLPQDDVPDIYDRIKSALQAAEEEKGKKQMKDNNKKLEESIRLTVRSLLKQIIQEAPPPKMPKGSPEWNPATYVPQPERSKPKRVDLASPGKKQPRRPQTPEDREAAWQRNTAQLRKTFSGENLSKALGSDEDAEKVHKEIKLLADRNALLRAGLTKAEALAGEIADEYRVVFEEYMKAKSDFEKEDAARGVTSPKIRPSQLITDNFIEYLNDVTKKDFNKVVIEIGTYVEDALKKSAMQLESAISDAEEEQPKLTRGYTTGAATGEISTLKQTAEAIGQSIANVKKITPKALGKYMLGMRSSIAPLIIPDEDISSITSNQKQTVLPADDSATSTLGQDDLPYTSTEMIDEIILSLQEDAGEDKFIKDMKDLFGNRAVATSIRAGKHYDKLKKIVNDQLKSLPVDTKLVGMSSDTLESVRQPVIDYITNNILGV